MTRLRRRSFLGRSLAVIGGGIAARAAGVTAALVPASAARADGGPRHLVLVRLFGGNDGLNTVIPWQDGRYFDLRPTLAVTEGALPLDAAAALHPSLAPLLPHWDAGRLAVVQSVGVPAPSLSHFFSEAVWRTGDLGAATPTGWIGRYLDTLAPPGDAEVRALDVAAALDPVFRAERAHVFALPQVGPSISFPTDAWHPRDAAAKRDAFDAISLEPRAEGSVAAALAAGGYVLSRNVDRFRAIPDDGAVAYPPTAFAARLRETARAIGAARRGEVAAGVFQVGLDGFDTHAEQGAAHAALLADLASSLDAFRADLAARGAAQDVLVLVHSEFGRRPRENGSEGTDHGAAAPVLVLGDAVTGGLFGPAPDLAHLDADDNLVAAVDFRSVYREILERWLPGGDPEAVLGGTAAQLPLVGFLPA